MRHASLVCSIALLLSLSALPAAAQLESAPSQSIDAPTPAAFEPSIAVHAGLRLGYATVRSEAPFEAIAGGPCFGVVFHHEAWRILDMRLHLLQFGAAWSERRAPELASELGGQLGTGLRARAGIVSFAATALAGLRAWLASGDQVSFDVGGELSITFHAGCDGIELGYQVLATASTGGFADAPSHGLVARWAITNGGPDREACRERR